MLNRKKHRNALKFVKKKHAGQFRANKVPVWHHLARVSKLLELILEKNREGKSKERFTIILAALGHDLIEDTKVTDTEIVKIFGVDGFELIEGMTNEWGDKFKAPYIRKVLRAPEGVRLIKLADLYDNIVGVVYNLKKLGSAWTKSYFLPIVMPMQKALRKSDFRTYKKTANLLNSMVELGLNLLIEEVRRYRS